MHHLPHYASPSWCYHAHLNPAPVFASTGAATTTTTTGAVNTLQHVFYIYTHTDLHNMCPGVVGHVCRRHPAGRCEGENPAAYLPGGQGRARSLCSPVLYCMATLIDSLAW
jgi:hypothetical protein